MISMPRPGRTVAVVCVALVVVAAFLPLCGVSLDWIAIPTAFVLLPTPASTGTLVESRRGDVRSDASLRAIDSRGPPSLSLA
jgi:hypothetical protein